MELGLSVSLDVALLYRINPSMAGDLFQNVGVDYAQVLIEPEAASVIRGLTSGKCFERYFNQIIYMLLTNLIFLESDAKALYSSGRHEIQDKVRDELDQTLGKMGIIIESVMLKDLELPESLSRAIEQKAKAEQESVMMEFVLTKEKQEAERKAIEARGIADFQKIVSEGISDQTLRWKGIEATEKLVASPNAKIVIMGNSKGDLPVIFNGDM
jgi:regulator of protease activity HflC (stomatin/prohibitin superfamily)